jgi:The ARF-like 2 binding protein BART
LYPLLITIDKYHQHPTQDTLTEYLETIGCSVEDLYAEVRETREQTTDAYLLLFIDCLVASADYDSFYKVMLKEGKKCKALRESNNKGGAAAAAGWVSPDFKADEKGSSSSTNARSPTVTYASDSKRGDEGKKSDSKGDDFDYK